MTHNISVYIKSSTPLMSLISRIFRVDILLFCGRKVELFFPFLTISPGIAKTGSGKTLAFLLPMYRHVLDQPELDREDGPIGS